MVQITRVSQLAIFHEIISWLRQRYYRLSKRHYSVHHVSCLDQENMEDFFERVVRFGTMRDHCSGNITMCCIAYYYA